jgi:hypothetical protein
MGRLPLPLAGEGRGGGLWPFRLHDRQRLPIRRFPLSTSPPQAGERAHKAGLAIARELNMTLS